MRTKGHIKAGPNKAIYIGIIFEINRYLEPGILKESKSKYLSDYSITFSYEIIEYCKSTNFGVLLYLANW